MNWGLAAFLSLIFTGACGTLVMNLICCYNISMYYGVQNEKKTSLEQFVEWFGAVMLCGLTVSGLGCLIFSMIKLIGG